MLDKILYTISIICWCTVIFMFSSETAEVSGGKSGQVIKSATISACVVLEKIGVINEIPSQETINQIVSKLQTPIRKTAHFSLYFVLALILMFALRENTKMSYKHAFIICLLFCFIFSLTDEYHQTFINGRSGEFRDCIIDTFGAFSALMVYSIFRKINHLLNKKKNSLKE